METRVSWNSVQLDIIKLWASGAYYNVTIMIVIGVEFVYNIGRGGMPWGNKCIRTCSQSIHELITIVLASSYRIIPFLRAVNPWQPAMVTDSVTVLLVGCCCWLGYSSNCWALLLPWKWHDSDDVIWHHSPTWCCLADCVIGNFNIIQ